MSSTSLVSFFTCFHSFKQRSVFPLRTFKTLRILATASTVSPLKEEEGEGSVGGNNGVPVVIKEEKRGEENELDVLWEDGYGENSVKDYLDIAKDMIKPDDGPPRWFSPVDCGKPVKDSPLLLFLPGVDGVGLGLILHHKTLGRIFEVRCLHIPVYDRTPFEGLVKFVENTVRQEYDLAPKKPVYLVGDSFGGCLALAVAARNPTIDLVLILVNPATSFSKSQLQPLIPMLEALPNELHITVPYLLSFIMGDPMKMAMVNVEDGLLPVQILEQLSENLAGLLPRLSGLSDIIPKETLLWKFKLLKSGAAYANSRLHAIKADVLVLASGKDNMLPSGDEAQRLSNSIQTCKVRYFKDNGHTLLLEDGINLLSVIKGTVMYRRFRRHDFIADYLPPTKTEFAKFLDQDNSGFRLATSPVMLSTLEDGKIVRGLGGVPSEGPILLVGYHMLMGLDLPPLIEEFLKEKKVMIRGMAHPIFFTSKYEGSLPEFSIMDKVRVFGIIPVSASNLYKLLSTNSTILLYPGGAREALHRKGEEYKLFWPDQPEFVRMAARFGATIVPFGVVGEDDILQYLLDYDDLMNIPIVSDWIRENNKDEIRLRTDVGGELANQDLYIPGVLPKIPGRFYYLFGKPIKTKGNEILKNRENANVLYLHIKSEIEGIMSYLLKNRGRDPYRDITNRTVYNVGSSSSEIPTFNP